MPKIILQTSYNFVGDMISYHHDNLEIPTKYEISIFLEQELVDIPYNPLATSFKCSQSLISFAF
jgi:hypothetical protein